MKPDPKKSLNVYARYSGIAFQMVAIILLGAYGGWKIDDWLNTKPIFTIILLLISVVLSIYFVTRDLLRK
jgi:F0F1-type ATP synthase assembly protein I